LCIFQEMAEKKNGKKIGDKNNNNNNNKKKNNNN
jgi:hypothetical protein